MIRQHKSRSTTIALLTVASANVSPKGEVNQWRLTYILNSLLLAKRTVCTEQSKNQKVHIIIKKMNSQYITPVHLFRI